MASHCDVGRKEHRDDQVAEAEVKKLLLLLLLLLLLGIASTIARSADSRYDEGNL
jgi:hypothetical protein